MANADALQIDNPLAARLARGELGLALQVKEAQTINIATVARSCGYDALYMDMQHTAIGDKLVADMAVFALANGVCPIVRIAGHDFDTALRLLDSGVLGIIVPDVETVEQARRAVTQLRFPPRGKRSVAGSWPHFGYRTVASGPAQRALDAATLLIVQIESRAALEQVDAIAALDGVDVLHMGSVDMSTDLGVPGDAAHPEVRAAFARIAAACARHGKVAGIGGVGGNGALAADYVQAGARFINAGNEWGMLMVAAAERARALRGLQGG